MKILYLEDLAAPLAERLRAGLGTSVQVVCAREPVAADLADCEIIIGGIVSRPILAAAPRLRYQIIPYAGIPQKTREILRDFPHLTLLNSHFNAQAAAEHAWALLLAAAKRLVTCHELLRMGNWSPRYADYASSVLQGRMLLLLGFGAIGRALKRMGLAFDMQVMAISRTGPRDDELVDSGTPGDLPRLLPEADVVIVALPATPETEGWIDARAFAQMKAGVLFVNIGRGAIVEEEAFHDALVSGRIGAAGIDTWWRYPDDPNDPTATPPSRFDLAAFDQLVMSPHRASHVAGRETARIDDLIVIIQSIVRGDPINRVDLSAGY